MLFRNAVCIVECSGMVLSNITKACRFLFIANTIGPRCLAQHIDKLVGLARNSSLPDLQHLIRLQDITPSSATSTPQIQGFSTLLKMGRKSKTSDMSLRKVEQLVSSSDVATLQFTSGIHLLPSVPIPKTADSFTRDNRESKVSYAHTFVWFF